MPAKAPNIAAEFLAAADRYADQPAMGMAGDDACLTYRELAQEVRECATFLRGIAPGQSIGLLSENRPEWGKAYLGILAAGGVIVPVDSLLKEDELARVFAESRISRLLVSARYRDIAELVIIKKSLPVEILDLETIPAVPGREPDITRGGDDPAVLIFTSGTTGASKRVILTHNNILGDIDGIRRRLPFEPGERFLSVLPLHHTFEATGGFLFPLMGGGAIYYVRELNSREIISGVKKHQITRFIAVPLLFEKLYHGVLAAIRKAPLRRRLLFKALMAATRMVHVLTGKNIGRKLFAPLRERAGLASLKLMVSGGAPLPVEIGRGFHYLGFDFVEGYGMTETSPVLTVNPIGGVKFGSVGLPLDNALVKIAEPDVDGVGEIIARGPMITPGYQDNPAATAELLRDGWLYTGDLGRIDKDGYLYIKGRAKNLIVSAAGKNIYPEEIEAALSSSPFVLEVMVYGQKVESGREEVAAMIYPDFDLVAAELGKPREQIGDDDLKTVVGDDLRRIGQGLADYKRVKHITYLRREMEKTSSKKIKRGRR